MLAPVWLALALVQVTEYSDRAAWEGAVGGVDAIGFAEFPDGTLITGQYASYGLTFTQGNDAILSNGAFVTDGKGLDCWGGAEILFAAPTFAFGVEFPGALQMDFYDGGNLIWSSGNFAGGGTGFFAGIVSATAFTRVVIDDWTDHRAYLDGLLLPRGGMVLSFTGDCPGVGTVSLTQATRDRGYVLAAAPSSGAFTIPGGFTCGGTVLGLGSGAFAVATLRTDAHGEASIAGNLPPALCGYLLQVVDLTSCETSNVVAIF